MRGNIKRISVKVDRMGTRFVIPLFAAVSFLTALASAQTAPVEEFGMGLLLDDKAFDSIPKKARLLTRDYRGVPPRHSIKRHAPEPQSQGQYPSCVGWAAAYAAFTTAKAAAEGWTNREQITREAFSPRYLYNMTRHESGGPECRRGAYMHRALEFLRSHGTVKNVRYSVDCETPPDALAREAHKNRLDNYFALFGHNDRPTREYKISSVKKSISQNKPVMIAMNTFGSFKRHYGDLWNGFEDMEVGFHAMCVVGYDDQAYGGAFEIMNSWGTRWGSGGFTWIRYGDFAKHVRYATEIYAAAKERIALSGGLKLVLSNGHEMTASRLDGRTLPTYRTREGYISGTRYRIFLSNNEPAYVYVIGSDLTNKVNMVFPPNDNISPALIYAQNNIALPSERHFIEMDKTRGTDFILLLYSADELPIGEIADNIRGHGGSFEQKVTYALGEELIPQSEIETEGGEITFSSKSAKSILAVVVEIGHD